MPESSQLRTAALAIAALVVTLPLVLIRDTGVVSATPTWKRTPRHKRSPSPSPTPTRSPSPDESPTKESSPSPSPSGSGDLKVDAPDLDATASPSPSGDKKRDRSKVWWHQHAKFEGTYTTDPLVALAEHALQFTDSPEAMHDIYAPFIIAGPSTFSDTWGSVRYGEGDDLRPHLGQDVFCERDAPVLAAEPGYVEFSEDDLGGNIARLHHDRGGYWYYAHLSAFAPGLSSGDRVETGDVIGYCGTSGNAKGTSPHVHFGSYPGPRNPMKDLIGWLEQAEEEAEPMIEELIESGMQVRVAKRLFGEILAPAAPAQVVSDDEVLDQPLEQLLGLAL